MSLTKWGKAAIGRLLDGEADKHANPFYASEGRTWMRFDSIEFGEGPRDEFGRLQKNVTFLHGGVRLYTMTIAYTGPDDSIRIHGIEGRMGISVT